MTRDYAKPARRGKKARNTRHRSAGKTVPAWLWLLAGIFIGATGMQLYTSGKLPVADTTPETVTDQKDRGTPARPRFDFYTLLTETEELVPDDVRDGGAEPQATAPDTTEPKQGADQPQAPREVYVLQAGAFKNPNDADSMRARLLLLNMQASVETVSPRPGETWHRVLVGPFHDTRVLGDARKVLQQNGIDSIQVKRKL